MGALVEAALCMAVWKAVGFIVLLPMGVLFLGYLIYIMCSVLKEWRKK
jgi:preprotein translocase subunit Sss1